MHAIGSTEVRKVHLTVKLDKHDGNWPFSGGTISIEIWTFNRWFHDISCSMCYLEWCFNFRWNFFLPIFSIQNRLQHDEQRFFFSLLRIVHSNHTKFVHYVHSAVTWTDWIDFDEWTYISHEKVYVESWLLSEGFEIHQTILYYESKWTKKTVARNGFSIHRENFRVIFIARQQCMKSMKSMICDYYYVTN